MSKPNGVGLWLWLWLWLFVAPQVRQVDCVTVKGSNQPLGLFCYDLDLAAAEAELAELAAATAGGTASSSGSASGALGSSRVSTAPSMQAAAAAAGDVGGTDSISTAAGERPLDWRLVLAVLSLHCCFDVNRKTMHCTLQCSSSPLRAHGNDWFWRCHCTKPGRCLCCTVCLCFRRAGARGPAASEPGSAA